MINSIELNSAYDYCQQLAQSHYENFPVASLLLPKRLRQPISVIYAFARTADDIADEGNASDQQRLQALTDYQQQLAAIEQGRYQGQSPIFIALNDVIAHYQLPIQLFYDLLSAFSQDVSQQRYQTDAEVLDYCRRSANPVGRLLLHLGDETSQRQLEQSDAICTALQLINFYQDIKQDLLENDRLYLPLDDLSQAGFTEYDLNNQNTTKMAAIFREKYLSVHDLLLNNTQLGESVRGRLGWEIRTITLAGLMTLKKLSAQQNDNLTARPRLSKWRLFSAASTALWPPLYRQSCQLMLKQIAKYNARETT
jgi:squalene synthase HpnC